MFLSFNFYCHIGREKSVLLEVILVRTRIKSGKIIFIGSKGFFNLPEDKEQPEGSHHTKNLNSICKQYLTESHFCIKEVSIK